MNQQFYTRQDLVFMQIWVGLGYRWVFVLRFTTQWVGLGWRFTTHNPHGLGLGSRLSTHRWVLARTITNHGIPKYITSDQDKLFTLKFWKSLTDLMGIDYQLSTVYYL